MIWHEKTGLMYTKYTSSYYRMYLHYCIRSTKSVNCIRFPMKSCINGENCAGITCVYMKLFSFEIQKCGKILCAHKPYFLMPGHKLGGHSLPLACTFYVVAQWLPQAEAIAVVLFPA